MREVDEKPGEEGINLKKTASMKVKADVRLLMAEARVGKPSSIPLYEHIRPEYLSQKDQQIMGFFLSYCIVIFVKH